MRIGFVVEGSTDRAFLTGLSRRWCSTAQLMSLGFRGTELRPREYKKVCGEAQLKGADVVVILTDTHRPQWREVLDAERSHLPEHWEDWIVLGVAHQNIECWICADVQYVANELKCPAGDLQGKDPKMPFQRAIGVTRIDKKEEEIAALICGAPSLKAWLRNSDSFKQFYDDVRLLSRQKGCSIPNEMEASRPARRKTKRQ